MSKCRLYRHFASDGSLLYVGISLNAVARLASHREGSHWFDRIARVEIEVHESRELALEAEKRAIQTENPAHNIQCRVSEGKEQRRADKSRERLLANIVKFQVAYTAKEIAQVLGLGPTVTSKLLDSGEIASISVPPRVGGKRPQRLVTGWQLIDYLEARTNAEAEGKVYLKCIDQVEI